MAHHQSFLFVSKQFFQFVDYILNNESDIFCLHWSLVLVASGRWHSTWIRYNRNRWIFIIWNVEYNFLTKRNINSKYMQYTCAAMPLLWQNRTREQQKMAIRTIAWTRKKTCKVMQKWNTIWRRIKRERKKPTAAVTVKCIVCRQTSGLHIKTHIHP